ncbi:MAG TPA: PqqD family protein, partial [Desulfopila sp.]|nr:PqqD family protein [Desulfopila sp.]
RRFQQSQEFPTKKLQLDAMGSHVWKEIDGNRNVSGIISRFADHYRITIQEAEKSVTTFLFELGRRGIIAMR